jgi:hypothetical protein
MEEDKGKDAGGGKGDRSKQGPGKPPVPPQLEHVSTGGSGPYGQRPVPVFFVSKPGVTTPNERLWQYIQQISGRISFNSYAAFLDRVLSDPEPTQLETRSLASGQSSEQFPLRRQISESLQAELRQHLFGPDAYALLQLATEVFLIREACGVPPELVDPHLTPMTPGLLPYLDLIRQRLADVPLGGDEQLKLGAGAGAFGIPHQRIFRPCFVELIWSYWHEQGMLVQTLNAIAIRYQNMRQGRGRDPLAAFELDPLRPLNNFLWGYLQAEHRRLSVVRRAYEYDHQYGLRLQGRAVPDLMPADSRAKFMPAFHELLYQTHAFYRDDDIATVQADSFPVVNALRELHFVLTEGMQNQYGDLPSQARIEMMIQQWFLARQETREFLRGRVMVPYPERWMDSVDTMKALQGWADVPMLYFNELAVTGEQLLLSVRYADWATQTPDITDKAAEWARHHRSVVQRYVYAYRMVTGVDLTVDRVEVQPPQARYSQPPMRTRLSPVQPAPRMLPDGVDDGGGLLGPPPATRGLLPSRNSRGYKR